jgi:xylose isomerase
MPLHGQPAERALADPTSYEQFDATPYSNGRGFGFVELQQLMLEHLMRARP